MSDPSVVCLEEQDAMKNPGQFERLEGPFLNMNNCNFWKDDFPGYWQQTESCWVNALSGVGWAAAFESIPCNCRRSGLITEGDCAFDCDHKMSLKQVCDPKGYTFSYEGHIYTCDAGSEKIHSPTRYPLFFENPINPLDPIKTGNELFLETPTAGQCPTTPNRNCPGGYAQTNSFGCGGGGGNSSSSSDCNYQFATVGGVRYPICCPQNNSLSLEFHPAEEIDCPSSELTVFYENNTYCYYCAGGSSSSSSGCNYKFGVVGGVQYPICCPNSTDALELEFTDSQEIECPNSDLTVFYEGDTYCYFCRPQTPSSSSSGTTSEPPSSSSSFSSSSSSSGTTSEPPSSSSSFSSSSSSIIVGSSTTGGDGGGDGGGPNSSSSTGTGGDGGGPNSSSSSDVYSSSSSSIVDSSSSSSSSSCSYPNIPQCQCGYGVNITPQGCIELYCLDCVGGDDGSSSSSSSSPASSSSSDDGQTTCPTCGGTGSVWDSSSSSSGPCPTCNGTGRVPKDSSSSSSCGPCGYPALPYCECGYVAIVDNCGCLTITCKPCPSSSSSSDDGQTTCPTCGGTGSVFDSSSSSSSSCPTCGGTGKVPKETSSSSSGDGGPGSSGSSSSSDDGQTTCPTCGGTGQVWDSSSSSSSSCPTCDGTGRVPRNPSSSSSGPAGGGSSGSSDDGDGGSSSSSDDGKDPCPTCGGTGQVWDSSSSSSSSCPTCGGTGRVPRGCPVYTESGSVVSTESDLDITTEQSCEDACVVSTELNRGIETQSGVSILPQQGCSEEPAQQSSSTASSPPSSSASGSPPPSSSVSSPTPTSSSSSPEAHLFDKSSWSGVIPEPYKTYFDQSADRWNNYIRYNPAVRDQIPGVLPGWNGLALKSGGYEEVNDSQTNVIASCAPYNFVDITGGPSVWINALNFSVTVNRHWEGYFSPSDWVNIITHEMGHALGIGIFWQSDFSSYGAVPPANNFLDGASYSSTQEGYNEVAAVSRSKTPLESSGGAGTSSAHWEDNYRASTAPGSGGVGYPGLIDELMVGSIDAGARRVIGTISIKNLVDYGYQEKNPGSSEGVVTINQSVTALAEPGIHMDCSHPQEMSRIGTIDIGG